MAADITNVKLGVCSVKFNNVDLGHTNGGVVVTYTPKYHDVTVDKYGNTVVEKVLIGEKLTAKVPLAESTIANLAVAMPAGTSDTDNITVGKQAGELMAQYAKALVLHPIANEAADLDEDVNFYKAIVSSEIALNYTFDGERVVEVTFEALLDETKSDGAYLGLFGDST
jgi:hypothetical protein